MNNKMYEHITIIYSNFQDPDCERLNRIWRNLPNVDLIEIKNGDEDWEEKVESAMINEADTIIFTGHGTEWGLLYPYLPRMEYILYENNVNLIKAKNIIFFFCYAREFLDKHKDLNNVLATSMFISNVDEAKREGFIENRKTQNQIINCDFKFCNLLNYYLKNKISLENFPKIIKTIIRNKIDKFNYNGVIYR